MKRLFCMLLCCVLALTLAGGALAGGGPAQNYGSANEENSAVVVQNGAVSQNAAFGSVAAAPGGGVTGTGASGIYLTGANDAANGLYIAADSDDAVYAVGGAQELYDVPGVGAFNSVIDVTGPTDADPEAENCSGVGVTAAGGLLTLENTYIHTAGYRASAVYTMSGTPSETDLVLKDSVLWADGAQNSFIPDFKLLVGTARATLFLGEDIWLYNSAVVARDWGALSHDTNTADIQLYAVNSYAEANRGGYCLYALNGTQNFLYGSRFVGAQYGMFVMGAGEAALCGLDEADSAALTHADGVSLAQPLCADGKTLMAGGVNAVVFHVNGSVMEPGVLTVKNAVLSTVPEDIVSAYGNDMDFDLDSYLLKPALYGESWFYLQNCLGSAIVTRSHGGVVSIDDGAELRAANGVLLQTLVGYDSGAGSIYHDSADTRVLKDVTLSVNAPIEGDVLHQDYQRELLLNVNAAYTGRVTTGSITAWNALWTAENMEKLLSDGGHADDFALTDEAVKNIRSCLVREENAAAYTDVFGVRMTVGAGGTWNVRGQSSVLTLTVAPGGAVNADAIYINCAFGADGYLDPAAGTEVDGLAAGTYENVVLLGGGAEQLPVYEFGGEAYLRVDDLLAALGA